MFGRMVNAVCLMFMSSSLLSAEGGRLSAGAIVDQLGVNGGLFVHIGGEGASLAVELAQTGPWVGAVMASGVEVAKRLRDEVVEAGCHGQVSVVTRMSGQKGIPFVRSSVAALILESIDDHEAEQLRPMVAPGGVLIRVGEDGAWSHEVIPRPEGMDVWMQYHGDETQNDRNEDSLVGKPSGLQWAGGASFDTDNGVRTNGRIMVMFEDMDNRRPHDRRRRLVARDAFSGVRLWQIDASAINRYAFLVDEDRVYFLPSQPGLPERQELRNEDVLDDPAVARKYMVALDINTGEQVAEYVNGFCARDWDFQGRPNRGQRPRQFPYARVLLSDGVLVQWFGDRIYALDKDTGDLLWSASSSDEMLPGYGAAHEGVLVISEGRGWGTANSYLAGFNRVGLERIVARNIETGELLWTWEWTGRVEPRLPEISHLVIGEGCVGVSAAQWFTPGHSKKGAGYLINIDLESGEERWLYTHQHREGAPGLHGHSYFRTYIRDGKQWMVTFSAPWAFDLEDGTPGGEVWSYNFRCHPSRTSASLTFGSLFVGSFEDERFYWSEAARSNCDVGTFPANGLLYQTATLCGCLAWLPQNNAFTDEALPSEYSGERLQRGSASHVEPSGEGWPLPDSWPMHMRDTQRSNWTDTSLSSSPTIAWTRSFEGYQSSINGIIREEWDASVLGSSPVGSPSHERGLLVVPVRDCQAVVGMNPESGESVWEVNVEGRVDSAPTLFDGMVIFGTRLGWVYALDAATGEVIWRFFAAPSQRMVVANGQVESSWPIVGSVALVNGALWIAAGREMSLDGGYKIWCLNPYSGEVVRDGGVGYDGAWRSTDDLQRNEKGHEGRTTSAATPLVSDGSGNLFMQNFGIDTRSGEWIESGITRSGWRPGDEFGIRPGNYGLNYAGDQRMFGRTGMASTLIDVMAKIHAYRGNTMLALGTTRNGQHGIEGGRELKRRDIKMEISGDEREMTDEVWSVLLGGDRMASRMAQAIGVAGDTVVYVVGAHVYGVSLSDGSDLWEFDLPSPGIYAGMAIAGGQVTVICEDGTIVAIR